MAKGKGKITSVKIKGLSELYRKLDQLPDHVVGPPARNFMQRATDIVATDANRKAPIDQGFLRASIKTEIDDAALPKWGKVGTNTSTKEYAKGIEFGTKPHWPPPGVLAAWMTRKKMDPGNKMRGIYKAGFNKETGKAFGEFYMAQHISKFGTKAHPFLNPALRTNKSKIRALLPHMAREIEEAAGHLK